MNVPTVSNTTSMLPAEQDRRPYTYVTRRLPESAISVLKAISEVGMFTQAESPVPRRILLQEIQRADAVLTLLTERVDAEFLDAAPKLRIVANMAVGVDNIDLREAKKRGIVVTHTPDVLTEATADLAFALLLATARRLPEAVDYLRAGNWKTWSPMTLVGRDVHRATLGIVGLGRIGAAVARRARGFSMRVLYHNRRENPALAQEFAAEYRSLDDLLREADFVLLLTPLTGDTHHLIGERELSLMKRTACLISVGRGPVVDQQALYNALRDGRLLAAGLDVFENEPINPEDPLLALKNVVALPHIGSASVSARMQMAELAAQNIARVLSGAPAVTPVNLDSIV